MANIVIAQVISGSKLSPKVALIHLKISRQGDGYNITVRDVTVINDEKKRAVPQQNQLKVQNGLVCFLLDKSNAIIDSILVTDPLVTRYEYPGENGTIGSKEVVLDEKEVVIRSQYNPRMEYLRISKVTGKTTRQSLATLKLPAPKM
jgi:hypothetical protein